MSLLWIKNGLVWTGGEQPQVFEGGVLCDGALIDSVGPDGTLQKAAGEARVIDAGGRTVTPGFIDAHMHPRPSYPDSSPLSTVDLRPGSVATMDDLVGALAAKAAVVPAGQWIQGVRYEDTKLGRHPTRADLDQASAVHHIYLRHSSGHLGVANS